MCGFNAERIHKQAKRFCVLFDGIAKRQRPVGIAMPQKVRRNNAIMLAQAVEHTAPGVERLANGVHKDQRFPRPRFNVVDARTFMLRFRHRLRGGFRRLQNIAAGRVLAGRILAGHIRRL